MLMLLTVGSCCHYLSEQQGAVLFCTSPFFKPLFPFAWVYTINTVKIQKRIVWKMTSVRSVKQICWLFRDFKSKAESCNELTNSYFPLLFPIFLPHHNNWNNDRAFRSTDDFSVFHSFLLRWGEYKKKTPLPPKNRVLNRFVILMSFLKSVHRRI